MSSSVRGPAGTRSLRSRGSLRASLAAASVVLFAGLLGGCRALAESQVPGNRTVAIVDGEPVYDNYCAACHQSDGHGWQSVGAPSIGGLPEWYVKSQILKFRDGQRGAHFDDINGMKMRPMALALHADAQIDGVAEWISAMPRFRNPDTLEGGDPVKGKAGFAICVTCHGAGAEGNQALGAPPLIGHDDWYMMTQLQNFKAGVRGRAKGDATGATMSPMAATLADEQAMKDVIAYIRTLR